MESIKVKSKEWCSNHSNKGCTEQCDGCWQLKQAWGCEQHNMETAYEAGTNYVLEQITEVIRLCDNDRHTDLYKALWDCIDELRK